MRNCTSKSSKEYHRNISEKKKIKETMQISSKEDDQENKENFSNKMSERHVRVAVVGNVDAGKS